MEDRNLDISAVVALTGVPRERLYPMELNQQFPARKKISPLKVVYSENEVLAWMEKRRASCAETNRQP